MGSTHVTLVCVENEHFCIAQIHFPITCIIEMRYLLLSHEVFSNVLNLAAPHQVTQRKSQYFLSIVVAGIIQDFLYLFSF